MSADEPKRQAARAALAELPERGILGLGTGSTAHFFVEGVAELVRAGRQFRCVCTSETTRAHASRLGIPLLDDAGPWAIDVTVDGADEVSDVLDLSKGAGGALTREKIVAASSERLIIVCDASKRVARLGTTRPITIEILAFGRGATLSHLETLGQARLRDGKSDQGNLLVDLTVGSIDQPADLDERLHEIPGVVETGLFLGYSNLVLVAHPNGSIEALR